MSQEIKSFNSTLVGDVDDIVNNIIKTNKVRRFAAELNVTQANNQTRTAEIKKIMAHLSAFDNKQNDESKSKLTEIYDKVNTQTLHWKWSKLSTPQQKDRIRAYLLIAVPDKEKQSQAEKLIYGLIDSNKLKKNAITYNMETSQITGIFIEEYQNIIQESDSDSESDDDNDHDDNTTETSESE